MSRTASLSALLSTLLFTVLSDAAAASDSALLRCRAISDDMARLACYDALTPPVLNLSERAKVPMTTAEVETRTAMTAPAVASSGAATPAATSAPEIGKTPAAGTPAIRAQTADEFGLERKVQTANLDLIESRILGEFRGWDGKTKFTFENGQVWAISDGSSATYRLLDPVVRVERGLFGAFFLRIEGVNRSPKVKRLK